MERFKDVFSRIRDPYYSALDADEPQLVKVLTFTAKTDTELAHYRTIREWVYVHILDGSHFRFLRPRGWLTDELINAYVTLLKKRNDDIVGPQEGLKKKGIQSTQNSTHSTLRG